MNFLRRLFGKAEPIVDPNDIGTGSEDIYLMSLDELIRRLADGDALAEYEDSTANFYLQEELLDEE